MTDFRNRLLLWHRVLAQMTGTLSLSYGGRGVSKTAMRDWSDRLRTVAADMDSVTGPENSKLDDKTNRLLRYAASTAPLSNGEVDFHSEESKNEVTEQVKSKLIARPARSEPAGRAPLRKATRRIK